MLRHFPPLVSAEAPSVASYLDTLIELIKKRPGVYSRKIEQKKINHFTLFENSIIFFENVEGFEPSKKFEKRFRNYWTYVKHFNGALSPSRSLLFFPVHPIHCLKSTEHFYLFTVSNISAKGGGKR